MKKLFGILLALFSLFMTVEITAAPTEMSVMGFIDTGPSMDISINQEQKIVCAESIYLVDNLSIEAMTNSPTQVVSNGASIFGTTERVLYCNRFNEVEVVILGKYLSIAGTHLYTTFNTNSLLS